MTYSKISFEQSERFIQAIRILALPHESTLEQALNTHEEQLQAIISLRDAPEEEHWDRGLLQGLRSANAEIVENTAKACVERLENASGTERQDKLIKVMLDACFLNLSGRIARSEPRQLSC